MGAPIADRILAGGFPLAVWNRTRERTDPYAERGAAVLDEPSQALAHADTCVTMLADDAVLSEVVLGDGGVLGGARAGTTLIDMSTVSVSVSERVAGAADRAGVEYLRAPVSGNPGVVASGNLTIMVSGRQDVVDASRQLLETIGPNVLYVGEGERARAAKLLLQILVGGTTELLAEAMIFGESVGLERPRVLEVLNASVLGSRFIGYKGEAMANADYSATFTTAMMIKDIDLVLDRAHETGITLPFTQQLRTLLDETSAAGYADADFGALQERLRAEVR
jgi:3-hydroxyisobutyrate dehydrogenase-like beta-hydroxyacid dehydrogenase